MAGIPAELREEDTMLTLGLELSQKTLGVHWDIVSDCFYVATPTFGPEDNLPRGKPPQMLRGSLISWAGLLQLSSSQSVALTALEAKVKLG